MIKQRNIIALILAFFAVACATVVPPSGGEVDKTPPVVKSFNPENFSRNFHKNKVVIKFDEFVVLDKLSQQLVVSPQMPEKPDVKIQGKKVIIHLPDSLSENTTYTIFFGNAIVNYKENIPVANFQYVLSTGDEVDSLMIDGMVVNAFDHKPSDGAFVMLYQNYDDSIPYKERPYYLTKVESNGHFLLNNIHAGKYKLFVLKDMNSNYLFDQPIEEIAFVDSLVEPYVDPSFLNMESVDSNSDAALNIPKPMHLFMFTESVKEQSILSSKLLSSKKFRISFAMPVKDLKLTPLNLKKDTVWHFDWFNSERDTLVTWLTGVHQDTLNLEVADNGEVLDTLRLVLHKRKRVIQKSRRQKKKEQNQKPKPKKKPKLRFVSNARGGFPFYSDIHIKFQTPIIKWDPTKIKILHQRDSLIDTLSCKAYFADPEYKMHLVIPTRFKEYEKYGLFFPDSVFYDIYGVSQDTVKQMFVTTEMREYGSLKLSVDFKGNAPLIIQLLDSKNRILITQKLPESGKLEYPYLKPGNYRIKAIADLNNNGKWDTGDYLKKLQPERTYFIEKLINIRANWDVEQTWIIE